MSVTAGVCFHQTFTPHEFLHCIGVLYDRCLAGSKQF